MDWKTPTEYAAVGFLGYGVMSLTLSPSVLHFSLAGLSGALMGAGHAYLRRFPWASYANRINPWLKPEERKAACVSVSNGLHFREVSTKAPEGKGHIKIQGLDKRELFERLSGKTINRDTIPFHIRVSLEEGGRVEVKWDELEPHLKGI